uniref:Dimerisation domain-containing protein n=1 Tax=Candidatus Kentrum sp. SD TaxID=2126332 RepID=A0A451BLM7_9GAMM|nr:MAG: Dimerisation domain-containing protein [Candidatus Kentron sp. SD]
MFPLEQPTKEACDNADRVREMAFAFQHSQMLAVAARLGIADLLAEGPLPLTELAKRLECNPQSLARLLRALAAKEVFRLEPDGRYSLTPMAELLRDDTPGSLRATAMLYGGSQFWAAFGVLIDSIRNGQTGFDCAYGTRCYDYFAANQDEGRIFNRSMSETAWWSSNAILDVLDLPETGTVVDLGGSEGMLLAMVLRARPALRGVLYDMPSVVERAPALLASAGVADRCTIIGGDFADAYPQGAECYLIKSVLNGETDARAIDILSRCRAAIAPGGRVLVVDTVLAENTAGLAAAAIDITMLAMTGGKARTSEAFSALFYAAGLRIEEIIPTTLAYHVIVGSSL